MSVDMGKRAIGLSRDHKPTDEDEQNRIIKYGGKIYQ
jgi:serine/threonine protein phosphatase PrpC